MSRPTFKLLAISDRRSLAGDLRDWFRALAAAGVDAVQLREKDLDDGDLYELAREARALLPPPTVLLVNGRADVALAAGADGVHLPADGVPVAPLRDRFGSRLLIGRSTHAQGEVEEALREGADYVTFGPVFPTPGKGEGVGLAALATAAQAGIPVYALGGVKIEGLGAIAAAGAAGAAGIRLFQSASGLASIPATARRFFASEDRSGWEARDAERALP